MRAPSHEPAAAPLPERLDALTGLRFLCVAYVVVRHLGDVPFSRVSPLLDGFRMHAALMMPLFFVMSGFVLTHRYAEALWSGKLGAREFRVSRALRIWPIYLVALALRVVVDVRTGATPPGYSRAIAAQAVLVQNWDPPLSWVGNVPGWTVCVEAFLYLLFPWLVVRVVRMRLSRAFRFAAVAWIVGQLLAIWYVVVLPDGPMPSVETGRFYMDLLVHLPPVHFPSFLIGMLAARAFAADVADGRRRPGGLLALAGFLPLFFALGGGIEWVGALFGHHLRIKPFEHDSLFAPAWALLLYGLAHGGARFLGARPLVRLGSASYGLYILHFPIFDAVLAFLAPEWEHAPWFLAQFFALVLPLVVVSFERFEEPLRAELLARYRALRRKPVAVVP